MSQRCLKSRLLFAVSTTTLNYGADSDEHIDAKKQFIYVHSIVTLDPFHQITV